MKTIRVSPSVRVSVAKNDVGEYEVRTYKNNKLRAGETYYTDDKDDAISTAHVIVADLKRRSNPRRRRNPDAYHRAGNTVSSMALPKASATESAVSIAVGLGLLAAIAYATR